MSDVEWYTIVEHDLNRIITNLEGIAEYPEETDEQEAVDTMHKAVDELRECIRAIRKSN